MEEMWQPYYPMTMMDEIHENQDRQAYWNNKYMRCCNRNRKRKKNRLNMSKLARKKNRR
jgi:hypothetical protein